MKKAMFVRNYHLSDDVGISSKKHEKKPIKVKLKTKSLTFVTNELYLMSLFPLPKMLIVIRSLIKMMLDEDSKNDEIIIRHGDVVVTGSFLASVVHKLKVYYKRTYELKKNEFHIWLIVITYYFPQHKYDKSIATIEAYQ